MPSRVNSRQVFVSSSLARREIYRGAEYAVHFVPKVKVEVAVPAHLVDKAVAAVRETVGADRSEDGMIYVMNFGTDHADPDPERRTPLRCESHNSDR